MMERTREFGRRLMGGIRWSYVSDVDAGLYEAVALKSETVFGVWLRVLNAVQTVPASGFIRIHSLSSETVEPILPTQFITPRAVYPPLLYLPLSPVVRHVSHTTSVRQITTDQQQILARSQLAH